MYFKNIKFLSIVLITTSLFFYSIPIGYAENTPLNNGEVLQEKIALLPFLNFSKDKHALLNVMPELKFRLEDMGLEVVDWDSLSSFICKQRVRSTGFISKELAQSIGNKFAVDTILIGSIVSYIPSDNPHFGISARLIDSSDGSILWSEYASSTGEDFAKILGLGKVKTIEELVVKVSARLFSSFSTEPPYRDIESTYTIAVLPFQNNSPYRYSGEITMYLFLTELFKTQGFVPIEYGNIRKLIVDKRITHKGELNFQNIKVLLDDLGIDIILVGTVDTYSDGLETGTAPEVTINARLLDTRQSKILWFNRYHLNGEDDIIVLDWGRIRSVDKVAHTVVSRLVKNMKTLRWFTSTD
jgi:TolB-like protein